MAIHQEKNPPLWVAVLFLTAAFLLVYPQYFDDTLCYYRMEENDTMTVEYPWPLVETQAKPSL